MKQKLYDLLALAGIQIEISLEVMGKVFSFFWGYKTTGLTNEQLSEATQHLTEYTKSYFEFLRDNPGPINPPDDEAAAWYDDNMEEYEAEEERELHFTHFDPNEIDEHGDGHEWVEVWGGFECLCGCGGFRGY